MFKSLFDPTNKLSVVFSVIVANVALLTIPVTFSEAVPNAEQASIIDRLFKFGQSLLAEFGPTAQPGSVFDPAGKASVAFKVLAEDGTVLESVDVDFSDSVSNEEQAIILSRLASLASEMAG